MYTCWKEGNSFKEGEEVYTENGNKLNCKKLDQVHIGPFMIHQRLSNKSMKLRWEIEEKASLNYIMG